MMTPKLLRMEQVAEMTGVPVATLRYYRHLGTGGPQSARMGRRVVYREQDVLAWIDNHFSGDTR